MILKSIKELEESPFVSEKLHFKFDEDITCEVAGNRRVHFMNEEMSLTAATLAALKSRGYHWKSVQGAQYWTHHGQTLVGLRSQIENED